MAVSSCSTDRYYVDGEGRAQLSEDALKALTTAVAQRQQAEVDAQSAVERGLGAGPSPGQGADMQAAGPVAGRGPGAAAANAPAVAQTAAPGLGATAVTVPAVAPTAGPSPRAAAAATAPQVAAALAAGPGPGAAAAFVPTTAAAPAAGPGPGAAANSVLAAGQAAAAGPGPGAAAVQQAVAGVQQAAGPGSGGPATSPATVAGLTTAHGPCVAVTIAQAAVAAQTAGPGPGAATAVMAMAAPTAAPGLHVGVGLATATSASGRRTGTAIATPATAAVPANAGRNLCIGGVAGATAATTMTLVGPDAHTGAARAAPALAMVGTTGPTASVGLGAGVQGAAPLAAATNPGPSLQAAAAAAAAAAATAYADPHLQGAPAAAGTGIRWLGDSDTTAVSLHAYNMPDTQGMLAPGVGAHALSDLLAGMLPGLPAGFGAQPPAGEPLDLFGSLLAGDALGDGWLGALAGQAQPIVHGPAAVGLHPAHGLASPGPSGNAIAVPPMFDAMGFAAGPSALHGHAPFYEGAGEGGGLLGGGVPPLPLGTDQTAAGHVQHGFAREGLLGTRRSPRNQAAEAPAAKGPRKE